jgi:hypothetical protein
MRWIDAARAPPPWRADRPPRSYLSTPIGWAVRDTSTARLRPAGVDRAPVLMPTFFLLSGWLGVVTLARVGAAAGPAPRRRLVLLLAIFVVRCRWRERCGTSRALPARRGRRAGAGVDPSELPITPGHLWYLY